jgi:hypothetical protein
VGSLPSDEAVILFFNHLISDIAYAIVGEAMIFSKHKYLFYNRLADFVFLAVAKLTLKPSFTKCCEKRREATT